MKACTAVGRGDKSLLSDPGSEYSLGTEKKREIVGTTIDVMSKTKKSVNHYSKCHLPTLNV